MFQGLEEEVVPMESRVLLHSPADGEANQRAQANVFFVLLLNCYYFSCKRVPFFGFNFGVVQVWVDSGGPQTTQKMQEKNAKGFKNCCIF